MKPADQAVEELIQKYGKLVFHTIYAMTGDWEESQDLTQDTFHQAFKAIDAARAASGSQFREKAWLLRIALNTVRMQHRRRRLFRFIPFSYLQRGNQSTEKAYNTGTDTLEDQAAPVQPVGYGVTLSADPADVIAERDAVQRTMQQLPATLRECLLLSVIGNFSTSEIARMLDLQEAAVRQRLTRARKQFQQLYALESGEQVSDSGAAAPSTGVKQGQVGQSNKAGAHHAHQNHEGRVESREVYEKELLDTPSSISRRNYGEQLYRNPAATPFW
jgi:RNA polymerase sigma-70 factor (ECF subfamily)